MAVPCASADQLPLSADNAWVDVAPRLGTLVLFWSHRVEHEVMPALAPRYALSLWMHVDERQHAGWMDAPPSGVD